MKNLLLGIIFLITNSVGFSQEIKLAKPDTAYLRIQSQINNYTKSLGLLYLEKYYNNNSQKRSVHYYEWDKKDTCAFKQNFAIGIYYSRWQCKEAGGVSETITFPKMDIIEIRKIINYLFFDSNNKWITPLKYEPKDNGAGCYYEIIESKNRIVLKSYCGC